MTRSPENVVMAGAEPESIAGGPKGALVLHGFTGTPQSMRGSAHALGDAGYPVEPPLLPGHGTSIDDMIATGWDDWLAAAEAAYEELRAKVTGPIVVTGLSMGGALTCVLAARHPEVAGVAVVNPVVAEPPGIRELIDTLLDGGDEVMDGIASDIAEEGPVELAYDKTPLKPLRSMVAAAASFEAELPKIVCPVLILTSRQDHVVDPSNSELLAKSVSGPVEHVWLERSYHVATLDHDRADIESAIVAFADRVTA